MLVHQALVLLLERAKMVVEPSGAAAVAAIMDQPKRFGTPVVAVLSGGNVDPLLLGNLIRQFRRKGIAVGEGSHAQRAVLRHQMLSCQVLPSRSISAIEPDGPQVPDV